MISNGDFEEYWRFHLAREHQRLYPRPQAGKILPAFATITGAVVLGQVPTMRELAGIGLVIAGVALHRAGRTRLRV